MFEIEPGTRVPCDAVLLLGGAIVSETVLTGEPTPVWKGSLPTGEMNDESETDWSTGKPSRSGSSTSTSWYNAAAKTAYKIDQVQYYYDFGLLLFCSAKIFRMFIAPYMPLPLLYLLHDLQREIVF